MTNRIRLFSLVIGLSLLAASCATGTMAATVNGAAIDQSDVTAVRTTEVGARTDAGAFRGDLTALIVWRSMVDAAEKEFGITGLDTQEGRDAWVETASAEDLAIIESIASNAELTGFAMDVVISQLAVEDLVKQELANDPDLQLAVWEQAGAELVEVCASHILTETEQEVAAAKDRIDAGEDFASVADEVSLDTASAGGALPCPSSPGNYVESFAEVVSTAPIGEVSEPFQTEFGWHIALVESREQAESVDDIAADPDRWMPDEVLDAAFVQWRDSAVGTADVVVSSRIGRWFPEGDGIVPPPASP